MKRLSSSEKIRLEKRRLARLRNLEHRFDKGRPRTRPAFLNYNELLVPESLDLKSNYLETAGFFEEVRYRTLRARQNIVLDFSKCNFIDPAAGVVLTAEVQRGRAFGSPAVPRIHGRYPSDPKIERFLSDLGFFRQIGIVDRMRNKAQDDRAQFIQIESGIKDQGSAIESLRQMVFSDVVVLDSRAAKFVYRALSEAMSNVSRHAYDKNIPRHLPVLPGRWWMAGRWDRNTKEIEAIFFDQGAGIPTTLPKTFPELIQGILAFLGLGDTDGPMIRAAMEIGRTRTDMSHRGKGLNDLRRVIDFAEAGSLTITSGYGSYEYRGVGFETAMDLPVPIGGTLIEWRISGTKTVTWKDE